MNNFLKIKNILTANIVFLFLITNTFSFGKNKVEYQHLTWKFYKTDHFNVYFSQEQGSLPKISSKIIENCYDILKKDFSYSPKEKIPLIMYGNPNTFSQTNITEELIPEGVAGFTTQIKNRIVVPFNGSYQELRHVLHHELVHAFQFSILYEQFGSSLLSPSSDQLPLWFAEGLAEYLSCGWNLESDMFLMDAAVYGNINSPVNLLSGYMIYKGSQSFLNFLEMSKGPEMFYSFLNKFKETKNVDKSIKEIYKKDLNELSEEWISEIKRIYWPEIGRRKNPEQYCTQLTKHEKDRTNFNLKPRISPNGKMVAYFSDLRDYSKIIIKTLDGRIIQEIGQYSFSGSFEAFHPFRSGICWSPKSDMLAFITNNNGKDELRIFNLTTKKNVKTFVPKEIEMIQSPDWSPDGSNIVFCGIKNGFSDIFCYNIKTNSILQLTNDIFFEADPKYSPDGKSIVFSLQDTFFNFDRYNKNIFYKSSQLYFLNIDNLSRKQLTFTKGNKKSPCFSSDGKFLVYISDINGIDNIYSAPFENPDSAMAITDFIGGCSNPDIAKDTSILVFCLFQKGGWDIWSIAKPFKNLINKPLEKTKFIEYCEDSSLYFFTPISQKVINENNISKDSVKVQNISIPNNNEDIKEEIKDTIGASKSINKIVELDTSKKSFNDSNSFSSLNEQEKNSQENFSKATVTKKNDSIFDTLSPFPYRPIFTPEIVSLGLGTNTYYGYGLAGQLAAVFSDLLGNHQILIMGDVQGNIADYTHLFASYLNREYKLNFGIGGFYNREFTSADIFGDSLYLDTDIGLMFLLRFPFSMYSRIDLEGFYNNLFRIPHIFIPVDYGIFIKDTMRTNKTINIFMPSISYVYDNILWGLTGPLTGIRGIARVIVSPPIKSINASFASFDIDFRHYWHILKKFVWANRLSFGASVALRKESNARRFFLGGNENWFLYDYNASSYQENVNNFFYSDIIVPFRGWNYLDIVGTKFALLNSEFRFPFLKEMSIVWPLPISLRYVNGAIFTDIGNAWNPEEQIKTLPIPNKLYGGIGFGLRANLGIFVLRYDHAWKTDFLTFYGPAKDYFSLGAEF